MMKNTKLTCAQCKKPISGARTVINERYYCALCTYEHDYPDKKVVPVVPYRKPKEPQKETLFTPPPKVVKETQRD